MKQVDAVYQGVRNVVGSSFEDGLDYGPVFAKGTDNRAVLHQMITEGFRSGAIELSRSYTEPEMKNYVSGLISNWLRKDTRLNGGSKYQAKNPGSRAGCGDVQLRELRKLRTVVTDTAIIAEIDQHIAKRTSELNTVVIDASKLPESLRHLVK